MSEDHVHSTTEWTDASQTSPMATTSVPAEAAEYTSATLDPELRSSVNAALLRDGHVARIQEKLLHALHAHPTNWPTRIEEHALSLLRTQKVSTFSELLARVLEDVRNDTIRQRQEEGLGDVLGGDSESEWESDADEEEQVQGDQKAKGEEDASSQKDRPDGETSRENGGGGGRPVQPDPSDPDQEMKDVDGKVAGDGDDSDDEVEEDNDDGDGIPRPNLALPRSVMEEAVRATQEALQAIVTIES